MNYLYGQFSDEQIKSNARQMHSKIHKILVYADPKSDGAIFANDTEFLAYYRNLMEQFAGLNTLLGNPDLMVTLMSTLQAAYDLYTSDSYTYARFRRLILDSHGILEQMFGSTRDA